jgi:hypothetical protein
MGYEIFRRQGGCWAGCCMLSLLAQLYSLAKGMLLLDRWDLRCCVDCSAELG